MAKYFLIILILFSSMSFGQGYSNFGNTNPNDTARTQNNVLINRYLRLSQYAPSTNDTVFLGSGLPNGMIFAYSIKSLVNRISASIQPIDTASLSNRINVNKQAIIDTAAQIRASITATTLQGAIDNGNDLDKPSTIVFGSNPLSLEGQRLNLIADTVYSDGLIYYTQDRRNEYTERTLPDWGNVKDTVSNALLSKENAFSKGNIIAGSNVSITGTLTGRLYGAGNITISATQPSLSGYVQFSDTLTTIATKTDLQSSFDTLITEDISSLTDARFSRPVRGISWAGMFWNSDYFTQVGTTLNFIDLFFHAGQKITIFF